jgi:hypothetical protein
MKMKAKNQKVNQMNNEEHILSAEKSKRFFFHASAADFKKIPGSPIAYWASERLRNSFSKSCSLNDIAQPRKGITTADNDKYLRNWFEVEWRKVALNNCLCYSKWFPVNKGGYFRKWNGNNEIVINWKNDGEEIKNFDKSVIRNPSFYFKEGMTWNDISSGKFAMRYSDGHAMFEGKGPMAFAENNYKLVNLISFFNSTVSASILSFLCPTLNFNIGDIAKTPISSEVLKSQNTNENSKICITISKKDWDFYETSWDFASLPLLQPDYRQPELKATYNNLRAHWHEITLEMQGLEEGNNRIFIDAYGLQDELTPEVPLSEVTLTCNPHYRYSNNKNAEELEALLLADTVKEFISYAVGCMFGRYSLDAPGLILANQGEGLEDYYRIVSNQLSVISNQQEEKADYCTLTSDGSSDSFPPDADNVIPILDGDWFPDDITERFRKFLRVTFGEEHYEENLKFIEVALGKDIRKYFLKDFYNDHLRRYKKRPIYWLFSSPKGSFNALIYMHRYRPDTVSVVLNGYLREFRTKLLSRKSQLEAVSISASASPGEKTKALKEIESLRKMIEELESYERDVLYPLATEQIAIDLDDGVKVNYQKFGPALKKIPGLDAKEE